MRFEFRIVGATVVSAFGDVGRNWLARQPSLVADAASAWQLHVGAPFEPGGNIGWVAPVRRADGSDAVLKVECPGHRNPWAAKGLRHGLVEGRRDFSTPTRRLRSCSSSGACPARTVMTSTSRPRTDRCIGTRRVTRRRPSCRGRVRATRDVGGALPPDDVGIVRTVEPPVDRGVVGQADELFTSLSSSSTDTVLLHGDLRTGERGALGAWMVDDRSVSGPG